MQLVEMHTLVYNKLLDEVQKTIMGTNSLKIGKTPTEVNDIQDLWPNRHINAHDQWKP